MFCHNDIWQNNILYNGKDICIIDWEFCGYGDGFFDFAYIPYMTGFSYEEEQFMLKTYFGYFEMELWDILQQMKYLSRAVEAVWFFFHAGIEPGAARRNDLLSAGNSAVNKLVL